MVYISVGFVRITKIHWENSGMIRFNARALRKSLVYHTPKSLWGAASELGGYYAHKPCLCSSQQTSRGICGLRRGKQLLISTIDRPESRIAGKRFKKRC